MKKYMIFITGLLMFLVFQCGSPKMEKLHLAEQFRLLGQYPAAEEYYLAVVKDGTHGLRARYGLGVVYELQNKLSKAEEQYAEVLKQKQDYPGAHTRYKMVLGKKAISQNNADEAYKYIHEVLVTNLLSFSNTKSAIFEADKEYLLRLGDMLLAKGQDLEKQEKKDQARVYYKKAVEIAPELDKGHLFLGKMYYDDQKILPALKAFRQVEKINEENIEGLYWLGHCYYKLQDYDAAYRTWLKVKNVEPRYKDTNKRIYMAWNKRSWEFLKFQTAVDSIALNLQEITFMKNELRDAVANYSELGKVVESIGDISDLKAQIAEVLEYQDKMKPILDDLSNISAMRGDLERALKYQIVLKDILVGLENITNMKDRVMAVLGAQEKTSQIVTDIAAIADMKGDLENAVTYHKTITDVVQSLDKVAKLRKDVEKVLAYHEDTDLGEIADDLAKIAQLKDGLTQSHQVLSAALATVTAANNRNQEAMVNTLTMVKDFVGESSEKINNFIISATDRQVEQMSAEIEKTSESVAFVSDETKALWLQVVSSLGNKEKTRLGDYLEMDTARLQELQGDQELTGTEKYLIEAVQTLNQAEKDMVKNLMANVQ